MIWLSCALTAEMLNKMSSAIIVAILRDVLFSLLIFSPPSISIILIYVIALLILFLSFFVFMRCH